MLAIRTPKQKGFKMLDRTEIARRMQDRILSVVTQETGLTRPTLMKLRDNAGSVSPATQNQISKYLTEMSKPATN